MQKEWNWWNKKLEAVQASNQELHHEDTKEILHLRTLYCKNFYRVSLIFRTFTSTVILFP